MRVRGFAECEQMNDFCVRQFRRALCQRLNQTERLAAGRADEDTLAGANALDCFFGGQDLRAVFFLPSRIESRFGFAHALAVVVGQCASVPPLMESCANVMRASAT